MDCFVAMKLAFVKSIALFPFVVAAAVVVIVVVVFVVVVVAAAAVFDESPFQLIQITL